MLARVVLVIGLAFALIAGPAPMTMAKEKTKAPVQRVDPTPAQPAALDPNNATDLDEILRQADAAYTPTDGSKADYQKAFELYSLAAEANSPYALNQLGLMYDYGEFVAVDDVKAVDYYMRAADGGLIVAKSNLGFMYKVGEGVAKNPSESVYWFRKAADDGWAVAMQQLGHAFQTGVGVAEDHEEAFAWYTKAYNAGENAAAWDLSLGYLYGDGVGKDTQKAADFSYYALQMGVQVALDEIQNIGSAQTSPNYRRSLQELMKRDGFYAGAIDGSFGPKTMQALTSVFGTGL